MDNYGILYEDLIESLKNGEYRIQPLEIRYDSDGPIIAELSLCPNGGIGKKEEKEKMKVHNRAYFEPTKIIINGPATIFFWSDKTKTVVKCAEDDTFDLYHAYCVAVTKRIMGTNSHIKSILKHTEIQDRAAKEAAEFLDALLTDEKPDLEKTLERIERGLKRIF